jgi:hypothetical protein
MISKSIEEVEMSVDFDENPSPMRILHPAEIAARDAHLARLSARAELRDRFAGYALIGLLASGECSFISSEETAAEAWKKADAMMKERDQ